MRPKRGKQRAPGLLPEGREVTPSEVRRHELLNGMFDEGEGLVVEGVDVHPKDSSLRRIRLDGLFVASVDERDVSELGVRKGVGWDFALAAAVLEAAQRADAWRFALRSWEFRACSSGQMMDRLRRRGTPTVAAEGAVAKLVRLGLLDDRAYAMSVGRTVIGSRGAGARLIEQKLMQRKVERGLAKEVAEALTRERDDVADALAMARRRLAGMSRLDDSAKRRRIHGFLARRGYGPGVCMEAVRGAMADPEGLEDDGEHEGVV